MNTVQRHTQYDADSNICGPQPYFGACIHVPPPPSNQIVFVKSEEPIEISGMFDAVWVTGEIKTVPVSSDVAEAGYTMEAIQVDPYEF